MLIDVHTHFVPEVLPNMANRAGGDRWPTSHCSCGRADHKNIMISGKNFRTITEQCWSAERRIEDMISENVDAQVLSPMPELLSYWFDAKDTLDFSRYINDQLSQTISSAPKRFFGLGMLPLQEPELAAKEIAVLQKDFGLLGVEIGTHINGIPLGDPMFEPFFAEAEARNFSIFIHPLHPFGKERIVGPPLLQNLIGFPTESAYALASLITGGVLEKYPNLKVLASHGGGSFNTVLSRLNHGWNTFESLQEVCPKSPSDYAKKIYFDTLVYDPKVIKNLLNTFGSERLVIGSDYPFSIREINPGHWKEEINITDDEWRRISVTNCLEFLNQS
jgi:aminocarboxymuconate-semialdehyde decarboxylase